MVQPSSIESFSLVALPADVCDRSDLLLDTRLESERSIDGVVERVLRGLLEASNKLDSDTCSALLCCTSRGGVVERMLSGLLDGSRIVDLTPSSSSCPGAESCESFVSSSMTPTTFPSGAITS